MKSTKDHTVCSLPQNGPFWTIFKYQLYVHKQLLQIKSKIYTRLSSLLVWFWFGKKSMHVLRLEDTGFFRLQSIKVLWSLQFLGYLWTLRLQAKLKLSRLCPVGCLRTTSILVRAFWNFKLKVHKYPRNCRLHNTLISWSLKNAWITYCICFQCVRKGEKFIFAEYIDKWMKLKVMKPQH